MFPEFLATLFEEGRAVVGPLEPLSPAELAAGELVLSRYEESWRPEMPGDAPSFVPQAAGWAGVQFYRACQVTAFRNCDEDVLHRELDQSFPWIAGIAEHYSVDLVFHFLPDLFRMAAQAAAHDPLLECLRRWARDWPLSSVGIPDLGEMDASIVSSDPCLRMLYADRIVVTADASRLTDDRVCERIRASLGVYPELADKVPPSILEKVALGAGL